MPIERRFSACRYHAIVAIFRFPSSSLSPSTLLAFLVVDIRHAARCLLRFACFTPPCYFSAAMMIISPASAHYASYMFRAALIALLIIEWFAISGAYTKIFIVFAATITMLHAYAIVCLRLRHFQSRHFRYFSPFV